MHTRLPKNQEDVAIFNLGRGRNDTGLGTNASGGNSVNLHVACRQVVSGLHNVRIHTAIAMLSPHIKMKKGIFPRAGCDGLGIAGCLPSGWGHGICMPNGCNHSHFFFVFASLLWITPRGIATLLVLSDIDTPKLDRRRRGTRGFQVGRVGIEA